MTSIVNFTFQVTFQKSILHKKTICMFYKFALKEFFFFQIKLLNICFSKGNHQIKSDVKIYIGYLEERRNQAREEESTDCISTF